MTRRAPYPFWTKLPIALFIAGTFGVLSYAVGWALSTTYLSEALLLISHGAEADTLEAEAYREALSEDEVLNAAWATLDPNAFPDATTLAQRSRARLDVGERSSLLRLSVRARGRRNALAGAEALTAALLNWEAERLGVLPAQVESLEVLEPATLPQQGLWSYPVTGAVLGAILVFGLAQIALLSSFKTPPQPKLPPRPDTDLPPLLASVPAPGGSLRQVPDSVFAALREQLSQAAAPQTILVTSATGGTWRGEFTRRLAEACAASGHHTLLVDADLHTPVLAGHYQLLAPRLEATSIATWLSQPRSTKDVVKLPTETGRLFMVPGFSSLKRSPERLNESFSLCLERWRSEYDSIIIHGSPLLHSVDVGIIAPSCDYSLVLSHDETKARDLRAAKDTLERSGTVLYGLIKLDNRGLSSLRASPPTPVADLATSGGDAG